MKVIFACRLHDAILAGVTLVEGVGLLMWHIAHDGMVESELECFCNDR